MKFYGVFKPDVSKGVYSTWDACKDAVFGDPNASYCSFKSASDAFKAISSFETCKDYKHSLRVQQYKRMKDRVEYPCIVVDAACSGSPGPVEYRGIVLPEKTVAFTHGPFESGTNNIGEFLAIVSAIKWLSQFALMYPIYTDSAVAMVWVRAKECRTSCKNIGRELQARIREAEAYLRFNAVGSGYNIRKWDTKAWGEIPADYGRK